jgi:hypothetical protein
MSPPWTRKGRDYGGVFVCSIALGDIAASLTVQLRIIR